MLIGGAVLERKIYLKKMELGQALRMYLNRLKETGFFEPKTEKVKVSEAIDRVLARAVFALRSVPHYSSAAVDGIAVRSSETVQASKHAPKRLDREHFAIVNTGQPMPKDFDAVIMIEDVHFLEDGSVEIFEPVPAFHNVRTIGEDAVEYDMLFCRYHRLAPQDLALLLAAGVFEVEVLKNLECAVVPTGDEIVDPSSELKEGFIPETNSVLVRTFLEKLGATVRVLDPVGDDPAKLVSTLQRLLPAHDLVLFIGGSSAGQKDFVYRTLEKFGEIVAHGLSTDPVSPQSSPSWRKSQSSVFLVFLPPVSRCSNVWSNLSWKHGTIRASRTRIFSRPNARRGYTPLSVMMNSLGSFWRKLRTVTSAFLSKGAQLQCLR